MISLEDYQRHLHYLPYAGPEIVLKNLSVQFQKSTVLNNLNFRFAAGKTTAIIGPNGSGKSTLLKTLLGQFTHEGEIALHWQNAVQRHIAYVPQHIDFDRELPMNEEDFMGMLLQKRPIFLGLAKQQKAMIHFLLHKVQMFEKRKTKIGRLSGGELKRMLLIQALYPEAGLFLFDEPLASLDESGIALFKELIRELQAMNKTVIWVEHDLLAVREYAQDIVAINRQIIYQGDAAALSDSELLLNIFSHKQESPHV